MHDLTRTNDLRWATYADHTDEEIADMRRQPFDPTTDPRACSQCKSEDVVETIELVPSRRYRKIRCANGHVTHGMPTRAYFEETS